MKSVRNLVLALVMASALAAGCPHTARAESDSYRNYGWVGLGTNEFTGDFDDAGYDAGGDLMLGYGRYLAPNLILEGTIDLFATEEDFQGSTTTVGGYWRDDEIAVSALLATVKGVWPVGPVALFGGGGVGLYALALNSEITTTQGKFDKDTGDGVFGVHLVAGADYDITERFFIGVQGLYRWTGDIDIDETAGSVPVQLEGDLSGYVITLKGGFRF